MGAASEIALPPNAMAEARMSCPVTSDVTIINNGAIADAPTLVKAGAADIAGTTDAMLAALRSHMGNRVAWREPHGGFFVWLTLNSDADTSALLPDAIKAGVTYVPGSSFFHDGSGANHLRLSFSTGDPDRFEEGIRRLAALL